MHAARLRPNALIAALVLEPHLDVGEARRRRHGCEGGAPQVSHLNFHCRPRTTLRRPRPTSPCGTSIPAPRTAASRTTEIAPRPRRLAGSLDGRRGAQSSGSLSSDTFSRRREASNAQLLGDGRRGQRRAAEIFHKYGFVAVQRRAGAGAHGAAHGRRRARDHGAGPRSTCTSRDGTGTLPIAQSSRVRPSSLTLHRLRGVRCGLTEDHRRARFSESSSGAGSRALVPISCCRRLAVPGTSRVTPTRRALCAGDTRPAVRPELVDDPVQLCRPASPR